MPVYHAVVLQSLPMCFWSSQSGRDDMKVMRVRFASASGTAHAVSLSAGLATDGKFVSSCSADSGDEVQAVLPVRDSDIDSEVSSICASGDGVQVHPDLVFKYWRHLPEDEASAGDGACVDCQCEECE